MISRSVAAALIGALAVALSVVWAGNLHAQAPGSAPAADSVDALIRDLGIKESEKSARDRKEWRVPKKIVLVGTDPGTRAQRDRFAAILPKAEVVVVPNTQEAAKAATNADIIVGLTSYPGICE